MNAAEAAARLDTLVTGEDAYCIVRNLLTFGDEVLDPTRDAELLAEAQDEDVLPACAGELVPLVRLLHSCRDSLTEFAMTMSLCPIHLCDWAICFDDEAPGCEQVRFIFPHSHDT